MSRAHEQREREAHPQGRPSAREDWAAAMEAAQMVRDPAARERAVQMVRSAAAAEGWEV